jgi:hypothetical protein
LATLEEMAALLSGAGFEILDVRDSTEESLKWLELRTANMAKAGTSPITTQILFGEDFAEMVRNQLRCLTEKRIRTVSYICEA